jgi:tripartite-type tricarboxylate transporter receptor subunit TctC
MAQSGRRPGVERNLLLQGEEMADLFATRNPATRRQPMRFAHKSLLVALSCTLAAPVFAQGKWPERPIRVVNPFTPGGTSDLLMRFSTEVAEKQLGTQIIQENRPGAGGSIGSAVVAKSPPDGYTLLVTTTGPAAIAQVLFAKPPYDVVKDFTYLYMFGGAPILVAVGAKSPVKSIQDYVAAAKKATPTFANSGTGSVGHLAGALFAGEAGIRMTHVPFKGAPEAQASIVSGEVASLWNTLGAHVGGLKGGEIRGIAVTSGERSPQFPDIPTLRESGFPNVVVTNWFLLAGPAGLSPAIAQRVNDAFTVAGKDAKTAASIASLGLQPIPGLNLKNYVDFIAKEVAVWGRVMKEHGIKQQ